jgi:hypothetical protein
MEVIRMRTPNYTGFLSCYLLVLLFVLFSPFLFAQRGNNSLKQFVYPCFLEDKQSKCGLELSSYVRDENDFQIQLFKARSSDLKVSVHSENGKCAIQNYNIDPVQKIYSFFKISEDEVLIKMDTLRCSDYSFVCALFQQDYCGKQGKLPRYHYKALCDTVVDRIYRVQLSFTSEKFDNTEELKQTTFKDLKPMKYLHLISPLQADEFADKMKYPEKEMNEIFLLKAKRSREYLAENLNEFKAGVNNTPLEEIKREKCFAEIESLVIQNKVEEALDRYYNFKLEEYKLDGQELRLKFEMTDFNPRHYIQSRANFDRDQLKQRDILQYVHNPEKPGPVWNYVVMIELGKLFRVDKDDLGGYYDNALNAMRNMYDIKERLIKNILANADSLVNPLDCADFKYESCSRWTDSSISYLYFSKQDETAGNLHIVSFQKKNDAENNWSQDWIGLPFSIKPNRIASSNSYGNTIYFSTVDSAYVVITQPDSVFNHVNLNNYKLYRLGNRNACDSSFNYVCRDLTIGWSGMLQCNLWQAKFQIPDNKSSSSDMNSKIEELAERSNPDCVLYQKPFEMADLNLDGLPEFYSFSISNGEVIHSCCYTLYNNQLTQLPAEEALKMIQQDRVYKKLILYSQMEWE